jgi:hypothetical protein
LWIRNLAMKRTLKYFGLLLSFDFLLKRFILQHPLDQCCFCHFQSFSFDNYRIIILSFINALMASEKAKFSR